MKNIELKKDIYWVGGVDWDLRNFHGYLTQRGSTYNAYLIIDEKITLIDTVKYYLFDDMISAISRIIDPAKIDYIIANHVEMDHSGAIPLLKNYCPQAKIFCSPKGEEGLRSHYGDDFNFNAVDTGDTIDLGKRKIHFVTTPMVHWPDNMVSYCPEEKILFSNDGMGQHLATHERFDDEYPLDIILEEAKKYYANIVLPYGNMVQKELTAAKGLDIEMIAPSHGLIWRKNLNEIIENYKKWSSNFSENKALIIYDTMWNSTKKMACAIYDAFYAKGITTELVNLQAMHISDIMTKVIDSKYICVGSPTLNKNMMPSVAEFLTYFKGLAPKNRIGLAFGSYGWSCQSVGQIDDAFKSCGFETLSAINIKYIPREKDLSDITNNLMKEISV